MTITDQSAVTEASTELSLAQQRMWFLEQLQPGSALYNLPVAISYSGPLDAPILRMALDALAHRHESLRARLVMMDGVARQVIDPPGRIGFTQVDVAGDRERLAVLLDAEAIRPFDLLTGPLVRSVLYRVGPLEHILLLTMHHIISDGQSIRLLFQELDTLYHAFSRGEPSPLPATMMRYADYAREQRKALEGALIGEQLDYWRERLAGAQTALDLPFDRPRPVVQGYLGATERFTIAAAIVSALRRLAEQERVTLFTVLMAGFLTLLSRWSGQHDIVVGLPVRGRRPENEGVVGLFVNTLAPRVDLTDAPTFIALIRRVRDELRAAYRHQDVPFEKIVETGRSMRDMSRQPIVQVAFNYRPFNFEPISAHGLTVTIDRLPTNTAKFDLELRVDKHGEALACRFDYATALFDRTTIQRFVGHMRILLEAASELPETRISRLPLLTEAEKRQLLIEWNDTARDYSQIV